jgi:hypothetical protein
MGKKYFFPVAMQKCARLCGELEPFPWIQPALKPQKTSGGLQSKCKLAYHTSKMGSVGSVESKGRIVESLNSQVVEWSNTGLGSDQANILICIFISDKIGPFFGL